MIQAIPSPAPGSASVAFPLILIWPEIGLFQLTATPEAGPGWTETALGGSVKLRIVLATSVVLTKREGVSFGPFQPATPTDPRKSLTWLDISLYSLPLR